MKIWIDGLVDRQTDRWLYQSILTWMLSVVVVFFSPNFTGGAVYHWYLIVDTGVAWRYVVRDQVRMLIRCASICCLSRSCTRLQKRRVAGRWWCQIRSSGYCRINWKVKYHRSRVFPPKNIFEKYKIDRHISSNFRRWFLQPSLKNETGWKLQRRVCFI